MSVDSTVPGPGTLKKNRAGHNLLEVIIACFVFSSVSVLFTSVWAQQYRSMGVARNHLTACALGRKVLEEHLSAGFDACYNGLVEDSTIIAKTIIRGRNADCEFRYIFRSTDRGTTNPADFRELEVTVSWSDTTGNHQVNYATYIYRTT